MARRDVIFNIDANVEGEQTLETLARELEALGNEASESSPEVARLAERLRDIASQQSLIDQFRAQRAALDQTASALNTARERTQQLALELRNTEAPTRRLQNQFERARREVRQLAQAEQDQRLGLQRLRGSLQEAGISTRNLSEAQRRLNTSLRETQGEVATLRSRLQAAGNAGRDAGRDIERGMDRAGDEARSTADEIRNLRNNLAGLFAADQAVELAKHLADTADQWTEINAKLKLVTDSQEEFNQVQEALFQISQETRTALAGNVSLYARSADAIKRLGGSTQDAIRFTEGIAKALKLSGATADEATSVQLQLSQALASGVLRGEEFNAVMENGLRVSQALADGLGLPIGALRGLAEQGEITAEKFFKAFMSQIPVLEKEFATIPVTIGGAVQQLENEFMRIIGNLDKVEGVSRDAVEAINLLARNLDPAIDTFKTIGSVIGVIATQKLVGKVATALVGLGTAARGAGASMLVVGAAMRAVPLAYTYLMLDKLIPLFFEWLEVSNRQAEILNSLEVSQTRLQNRLAKIAEQTGVAIESMEDFNRAIEEGTIVFDEASGTYRNAAQSIDQVKESASKASQEMPRLNTAYRKTAEEMVQVALAAREMSQELDQSSKEFKEALQDLGIDAAQVTTGIRTEFSELTDSFTQVTRGFNAGNEVISLAGQKLALSAQSAQEAALALRMLDAAHKAGKLSAEGQAKAVELLAKRFSDQDLAAIQAAQSSEALATAVETASKHYEAGIITAEQYRQIQVAVQEQMSALAGATETAAQATQTLTADMKEAQVSAQQTAQAINATAQEANAFAQAFASGFVELRNEFKAAGEEALAVYEMALKNNTYVGMSFGQAMQAAQDAAAYTRQYLHLGKEATDQTQALNSQQLDGLRGEIDSTSDRLENLANQAQQARQSLADMGDQLQDELDRIAGNQEAIENRRYQEQLERIAELEKKGGETAGREAERSRQLAEQLHQQKLADIRAEEEEKRQQEAQRVQEERQRQEEEKARKEQERQRQAEEEKQEEQRRQEEERQQSEAPARQTTPPPQSVTSPAPPSANTPPKQVMKVIRVEYGNGRSFEVPADQEDNLIDFIEMLERAKRVT